MDERVRCTTCRRSRYTPVSRPRFHAPPEPFGQATAICRIDQEIGAVRLKIASILRNDPENSGALCRAAHLLDKMLKAKRLTMALFRKAEDDAHLSVFAGDVLSLFPASD